MLPDQMKRIGIFQYEWPLQIHTVNLAQKLAENGFLVDLYLYQCDSSFVNLPSLRQHPGIGIRQFKRSFAEKVFDRVMRSARKILKLEPSLPDKIASVAQNSLTFVIDSGSYDYFIGVEKKGLVWAGILSESLRTPYLYYSLELHIEGHPSFEGKSDFVSIRSKERKYHAQADGTIIQDELRAQVLLHSNGIAKTDVIYIPVSVTGGKVNEKCLFLHKRLGIDTSKKIILYIGQVSKLRGALELIKCAAQFGDDMVLVLHGPLLPGVPNNIDYGGKVFFSQDIVDSKDISELVSSAYIGIAFYSNDNINDRLTAFSSEKIAFYMQSGLPLIAYSNESYDLLMNHYRCGELVERIDQMPGAVAKIDADYGHYRDAAFAAYEHFYSFDNNIPSLVDYLSRDV